MTIMGGKGSGRRPKYNDELHEYWRKSFRKYYKKHQEAYNLAQNLKISVKAAERILKQQKKAKEQ